VQNDKKRRLVGGYLEAKVRDLKAIPIVIYVEDNEMKAEPPKRVVDEMMRSDVILATLNFDNIQIFAHTKARNAATDERGARVGLAPLLWPNVAHTDILKIRERTDRLGDIMDKGKLVRITGPGTDLSFSIEGRNRQNNRKGNTAKQYHGRENGG
jgi:leucyl aminopeptidase (aminopeptidase T)